MPDRKWESISQLKLTGFVLGLGLFVMLLVKSEPGFVVVLDHANLMFHEAGHVFVALFSTRLETYGGMLGQLLFPVVTMISFWRKGQPIAFATAVIWFFENWLNIARYLADARTLRLPLVGGGDHDWNTILRRWDMLAYDTQMAAVVTGIAWAGMAGASAWVLWRAATGRGYISANGACRSASAG